MEVREIMTPKVDLLTPDDTLERAAQLMRDDDIGSIPIQNGDRLVGMLTDRDIAVRAVAEGKNIHETHVSEAMSSPILYCYEDDDVEKVAENMGENQIRRLPVLNRNKRLVGIVSMGDLVCEEGSAKCCGRALREISQPTHH